MPAVAPSPHWFRVGYLANALRRCADEIRCDLATISVRRAVTLFELFDLRYRPQHVARADDRTEWAVTTDAPQGAFVVTGIREVVRQDTGRSDAVELQLMLRASPARTALGSYRLSGAQSVRGDRAFELAADAPVLAVFLDGKRIGAR
ncbi:hypothetical protein QT381_09465 [Galbitalea sp. SE-J8]|uniref:hypothetical protein n=1 Tax=Galbitalea sp. SE-J8 TaxID=3054952 RepID=UPI00259CDF2D|nr:hypothetical protein [Galbitalea sp. SE-J8]MDM4763233.1 hypothetical protein [Galbitalea sp. SE-J8]